MRLEKMNKLEQLMANRVLRTIEVDKRDAVEKSYEQYLFYTRNILVDFDKDLQSEVMFKYAEYKKGKN